MTILVGTASWTDKSLIESGKFYPPSAKDAATRLKYYASQFPDGGGRFELLRHARASDRATMGGAHTRALRLQRQGFSARHRTPDPA